MPIRRVTNKSLFLTSRQMLSIGRSNLSRMAESESSANEPAEPPDDDARLPCEWLEWRDAPTHPARSDVRRLFVRGPLRADRDEGPTRHRSEGGSGRHYEARLERVRGPRPRLERRADDRPVPDRPVQGRRSSAGQ